MTSGNRIASKVLSSSVIFVLVMLSGCSSLPALDEVESVSLNSDFRMSGDLAVDVDGDPNLRPGKMAMDGLMVAGQCEYCIFLTPVTVPLMASIGAVATATETLPKSDAKDLNRYTANALAKVSFGAELSRSMRDEALRRGLALGKKGVDARLDIVMTSIEWDVSVGNQVSIVMAFRVTGFAGGRSGQRNITYRSDRIKAYELLANQGEPIEEFLVKVVHDASEVVWQRLLNREKAG